ncbi:nucleotidyl transferase AbiEii/AbiGii toxin family protein [Aerococcus urinaeequi]|uniref:nucleotidyl transferase AbiEii/AbiGii toxin family protein n=1 Tax=Aerococcus urinaeequi TaxID=51665 RepID=UPI000845D1F1|nr:nucleotidyl transferase AbiEii/AbiGii toxin family protein [Aerococcus urinaeequi]
MINLEEIRTIVIASLFSDSKLMEIWSLKGGNALEIAHKLNSRSSMDVDVSMDKDFEDYGLTKGDVIERIKNELNINFSEFGYTIFDEKITPRPGKGDNRPKYWGGYLLEFKIIETKKFIENEKNINQLRKEAEIISEKKGKKIKVDISKFELTSPSEIVELDDYLIRVYTPLMIVYEKIRAICQQMEEYREIMHTSRSPRARDFYDIWVVIKELHLREDVVNKKNIYILEEMFKLKDVPLELLQNIKNQEIKEFHKNNFISLKDTIKDSDQLEDFEYYYNYVVELVSEILKII